jgi:predicted dehydrogenase
MLCEKPLASTEAECRAMIDAAAAAGVMLFTAFDYRFSPAAQRIRGLVAEGAVGTVRSLRLLYLWHLHGKFVADAEGRRVANARRHGRMLEGGPMVDCGVHQIDLARWWLQSEVCAWTAAGAWVEAYAAPDHVYLHLDHENGAHTCVEMSYSYGHTAAEPSPRFLYELIGTEGLIRYDRESRRFELRDPRGTRELAWSPEKNFAGMYAAFARALAGEGADDLPTGEDGLAAARLSREATEALIAGRRDRQWA